MHGNAPRCYLVADLDPPAFAADLGATLSGVVLERSRALRMTVDRAPMPVLAIHPRSRERRLGTMSWGMGADAHVVGVHRLGGRGVDAEAYRRRRCAAVLTEYALDPDTKYARAWSGPPTLHAAIYDVVPTATGSQGRFALVALDRTPVPLTIDEAESWILSREHVGIDDAITLAKVDAILHRS